MFFNSVRCSTLRSAPLILTVVFNCQVHDLWLGSFFKKHLGKLTKERRRKISHAMPSCVHIERKIGNHGAYYTVAEADLIAWAERARNVGLRWGKPVGSK